MTAAAPGGSHGAIRDSYDAVASQYREHLSGELAGKPLDRALLSALLEGVKRDGAVADLGCGPGHVTGWIADLGVRAIGVDLAPAMVALARRSYPRAEFRVGELLELPFEDGELDAAVALYSLVHLEPGEHAPAARQLARVLRPGGQALVAFHVGEGTEHFAHWWGHEVDLSFHFLQPAAVAATLEAAGLVVEATLERVAYAHEVATRRAYLLARAEGG